jgi:hypothetical protein
MVDDGLVGKTGPQLLYKRKGAQNFGLHDTSSINCHCMCSLFWRAILLKLFVSCTGLVGGFWLIISISW